jgi:ATP-dependent helicase/nuclease subunit A
MSGDDIILPDSAAREHALDPERSFIVQAPAGSGKTELLVRRFARLLGTVERPEEVLAITFTRKAAAEMKKRVMLHLAAGSEHDAAELAPRLRIMTIDSLCSSLTRQLPVLARFGAQPGIAEREEADALYEQAATRTLALLESRDRNTAPLSQCVARLYTHLDNDVGAATRLLAGMLARRDQWLRRAGSPPTRAELESAFQSERDRLLTAARALHPDASPELAEKVLTKAGGWRKRPPAPADMVGNEPLREALCALLPDSLPPERYSDAQWEALEAILALLKVAAAELKLVFAERGMADFTEFAQGAVRALGTADDPSELLLRMDAGVRHILVDEFQDTSVSQWELLERLTAGWETGDGRTVFAVGDPMQSIYRFREAEVALFLHARHRGLGSVMLEPLTLQTNFRSQAGVVDWVNDTFARVLPAVEDEASGAVPYSQAASHPKNPALPGPAVEWHAFFERGDEARRAVQLVIEARAENPEGTCAILVRNRNALTDIVPELERAGLRFRAVEIEKLGEKQVVQDLYALTRALLHPADRIAWLALLRARWCGLNLSDLHALAGPDTKPEAAPATEGALPAERQSTRLSGPQSTHRTILECLHDESRLARLSSDGRLRAARLTAVLAPAMVNTLRGSLRERVEGTWLALGGPACVNERTELEDAGIFFDQLDRLEDAGDIKDMADLEAGLGDLYALPDLEAVDTDLQIMTVHKAKGLEFDTVIVPGLDRAPRSGERPLLAWKSQPDGQLLLAPINETGDGDHDRNNAMFSYVREQARNAEDTEAGRLFYVAATRAKSRLHLLGCVKPHKDGAKLSEDDGAVRKPSRHSLLGRAWMVAEAAFQTPLAATAPARSTVQPEAAASDTSGLQRLPADWARPAAPPAASWPAPVETARGGEQIEFSWVGETARHVGSVVHRWLQRVAEDGMQGWNRSRVDGLLQAFRDELSARGVSDEELPAAVARVAAALGNALDDERGRWLLGPQRDGRNEYRLTAVLDGERRNLVIDRTFVDPDGRRWIVDYKTSSHEGTDSAGFLDREQQRYRAQLERYAAQMPEKDKSLGLYFPMLSGWRDW